MKLSRYEPREPDVRSESISQPWRDFAALLRKVMRVVKVSVAICGHIIAWIDSRGLQGQRAFGVWNDASFASAIFFCLPSPQLRFFGWSVELAPFADAAEGRASPESGKWRGTLHDPGPKKVSRSVLPNFFPGCPPLISSYLPAGSPSAFRNTKTFVVQPSRQPTSSADQSSLE